MPRGPGAAFSVFGGGWRGSQKLGVLFSVLDDTGNFRQGRPTRDIKHRMGSSEVTGAYVGEVGARATVELGRQ